MPHSTSRDYIYLNTANSGLKILFGSLEADILEYLWDIYPRSVVGNAIQKHMKSHGRELSVNTVNTTLTKLREKGLVKLDGISQKGPGGNLHVATTTKSEFITFAVQQVVQTLIVHFPVEWDSIRRTQ